MRRTAHLVCSSLLALSTTTIASAGDFPAQVAGRLRLPTSIHPMASIDGRITLHAYVPGDVDVRRLGLLPLAPGLASVRLLPEEIDAFVAARKGIRLGWQPPLRPKLDRSTTWSRATTFRSNTGLDGSGVVVGIIDTGIDVTHPDLRNADGSSRVAWLLDMSRQATGRHPEVEDTFGCNDASLGGCAVYDATDINDTLSSPTGPPRDQIGHGTHVASIAAGNGLGSEEAALAGMAPEATLIAVRVTRGESEDIGDADALLAARFVFEQAHQMGLPAVVNMSLGADFGPHDGTSWLERGLASFVGPDQPGRAVVVAAGNSGGLYLADGATFGIHTEARAYPKARTRIPMRAVGMSNATVRGTAYVWMTWREGESLSVGLEGPDGETWIEPLPAGASDQFESKADGMPVEAIILNDHHGEGSPIPDGTSGAVMLVDGVWDADGELTILLEGDGVAELWVQGVGEAGVTAEGLGMMFVRGLKHGTVNIPATHPALIAVGASVNRASWTDSNGFLVNVERFGPQAPPIEDSIAYFSGAGPTSTGLTKPDITAPGVFIAAAMSRDANPAANPISMFAAPPSVCPTGSTHCLVVSEHHAIATGTSMATPAVAGAVALLLSMDPTLTSPELIALLQAGARWPQGTVPFAFQMGPGVLDVEGARESYELLGRPMMREPDPSRSWIVMGSPYARPDPHWPVCGFLETRIADGTLADGFDEGLLSLRAQPALIKRELARVAPGLWTFCVAAPSGSGGDSMHLEVRYRGERLGEVQHLPIGMDPFVASEGYVARGGCAMGTPGSARSSLLLLLLLVSYARKRRRTA